MRTSFFLVSMNVALLALACSSSATTTDPKQFDGTWELVADGIADASVSDDDLAAKGRTSSEDAWEMTLAGGSGTLQLTDSSDAAHPCVITHTVTLAKKSDGTGSIAEGEPGTLVSGPDSCSQGTELQFTLTGDKQLQRVSRSGNRLVVMTTDSPAWFAVFDAK